MAVVFDNNYTIQVTGNLVMIILIQYHFIKNSFKSLIGTSRPVYKHGRNA